MIRFRETRSDGTNLVFAWNGTDAFVEEAGQVSWNWRPPDGFQVSGTYPQLISGEYLWDGTTSFVQQGAGVLTPPTGFQPLASWMHLVLSQSLRWASRVLTFSSPLPWEPHNSPTQRAPQASNFQTERFGQPVASCPADASNMKLPESILAQHPCILSLGSAGMPLAPFW